MKQGAPISPSFTISSEDMEDEDAGGDDDDNDDHDEDDDDGCVLAATNLCLSHLAFTDEQRGGELDYI